MFRNGLIGELPSWLRDVKSIDWPMWLLIADHGRIGFINEVMSAHRGRAGQLSSSMNAIEWIQEYIRILELVNAQLGFRHDKAIKFAQCTYHFRLALRWAMRGNLADALKSVRMCIAEYRWHRKFPAAVHRQLMDVYLFGVPTSLRSKLPRYHAH
jgi:hypothetical protein